MKRLALNENGVITYCVVEPGMEGKGRCNHIAHQGIDESKIDFLDRIAKMQMELENKSNNNDKFEDYKEENYKEISQEEVDSFASKIDSIAGQKITAENFKEVVSKLSPEQIDQITKIGFEAAPTFSLPISDEHYDDENIKNKIYFANLPEYGIGGNMSSVAQMFDKVGNVPTLDGDVYVESSYKEGLKPNEYFARQFGARDAMINKGVGTSKPGFCIWENSIVTINDGVGSYSNILWKNLTVGDEFEDGSVVEEIQPWKQKKCYEVKIRGYSNEIVLSYDHLILADIIVNNNVVTDLKKSYEARWNVQEEDTSWVCIEDVYEFMNSGARISLPDNNEIEYIKLFKNGVPQKVRCISTSTGRYSTNGLIHHNTARKLFYAMSDTMVVKDCGGPYIDAMHCNMPEGHVCEKCANLTQGGEIVKEGMLVGGLVSTNLSEGLTQLSMKQMHVGSSQVTAQQHGSSIIMATLDGWGTSPIIQKMREVETTEERREILYEGLKQLYKEAGLKQDEFNLQMVARKLTSYKREKGGLRPINPGECCDIVSISTTGSSNNIFKVSELSSGYNSLTKPMKQTIKKDAANQILR